MGHYHVQKRVEELIAQGDPQQAFAELREVLDYPADLDRHEFADAMSTFALIAEHLSGPDFTKKVRRAAAAPDDPAALYAFAYDAHEHGLHSFAATALARALKRVPSSTQILSELCSNLHRLMCNDDAYETLRASNIATEDPFCHYLLAFNAIMIGRLGEARVAIPKLLNSGDEDVVWMARNLAGMLARVKALGSAPTFDVRDWHAVLNGGVLLHLSPHGFHELMHGRYAYIVDSHALIRDGIETLHAALDEAKLSPPRIWSLPNRSSQIVACAASKILSLPLRHWPEAGTDESGLIVAYDLDAELSAECIEQLRHHRPGQVLWAHASCWTTPSPRTPDATTFLYQSCASPWGGGARRLNDETGEVEAVRPDTAAPEEIAERIVSAERPEEFFDAVRPIRALVRALRAVPEEHAAGLLRKSGQRYHQRAGSPISSARFT